MIRDPQVYILCVCVCGGWGVGGGGGGGRRGARGRMVMSSRTRTFIKYDNGMDGHSKTSSQWNVLTVRSTSSKQVIKNRHDSHST